MRSLGFRDLRVRHHGIVARIELPPSDFPKLLAGNIAAEDAQNLKEFGFKFVTLDFQGFRSGSLNEGIVQMRQLLIPGVIVVLGYAHLDTSYSPGVACRR